MDYSKKLYNVLILSLFLIPIAAQSQIPTVEARPFTPVREEGLAEHFAAYRTFHIPSASLVQIVRGEDFAHRVDLNLPGYGIFALELFENPLQASNYVLTVKGETGITRTPGTGVVKTFQGNLKGGQYLVSMTIDQGFIYGAIQLPKEDMLRIEPLRRYLKGAERDAFIVYRESDQMKADEVMCEVKQHTQHAEQEAEDEDVQRLQNDCRTVQIAFADDWLMYLDYNQDIGDVENHNMGVINDVQTNYDTEFAHDLMFDVVEIWISTCSSCDPWTNSTNAGALLDDFTDWGPSGFDNTHDVAGLWTDRDFAGATIGISWLDAVCTPFRYLTTQDFSTGGGQLRSLLAHELGHNFGSEHDPDGSQTIMAPSLVVTNTWSASSITQINNYINSINCLSQCTTVDPPVADFSADETIGCDPFTVHFFDESTGPPTSWEWTFPGGIPSSSIQQNPTVMYQTPGTYDVILEVSNSAGTNTLVRADYITVLAEPVADFTFNQIDLTLIFTSQSMGAESWFWDFGDGATSTQENPSHTYDQDGEYEVTLTVSNDCGDDTYSLFIEVYVPPVADFSYSTDFGCAPLEVHFINESSDNVQSFEWLFPGGTPSSSTQENPVVTYNNPGFFSVTLIVENIAGVDELTINNLIEVLPLPEADFDYGVNGLSVQFVNASLDADSYLWAFGDGATSTVTNPLHMYQNGGSYQVTLTATNECGSDVFISTVLLNSAPIADFTYSVSEGCPPLSVTYISTSQGLVTSYNWSFPGGNPSSSTAPMPTVVYQNPGTYDARLIVGNNIGFDTLLLEDIITVLPDPVSSFTANIDGATVDFLNTSTGANTYNWLIDGNTFVLEDVTYTFDEDGDYPVRLIATGPCGSDTSVQIIHISTPPMAGFASDVTSGCQPLTVQFFNTSSSNATTFAWVFEGGIPSTSSLENPVVQYAEPGVYDVQLTVWSEAGMDVLAISELIEVSPLPMAAFSTQQEGLEIAFVNASQEADQYFWIFGDGNTSTEVSPIHEYEDFGTYPVMLIAQNGCGSDTMFVNLSLSTAPVPVFSAEQTHGCVPFEVQFIDMSQNGPLLWEWSFPGGMPDTSNLQNPIIVYFEPGIYPVTLRVSNVGGTQALVRDEYIHVAVPPVAGFTAWLNDEIVTFANQSQEADAYYWSFGDGGFDTNPNPIHIYTASGTYQVQLIASNACDADTITKTITVTVTGVENTADEIDIVVFPNPNEGDFTVMLEGTYETFDLEVYDLLGKRILFTQLEPNTSGLHDVTLGNAIPGMYSVILRRPDFEHVVKVVVIE